MRNALLRLLTILLILPAVTLILIGGLLNPVIWTIVWVVSGKEYGLDDYKWDVERVCSKITPMNFIK